MYIFREEDKAKIMDAFGREFFFKTNALMKKCMLRWKIDSLELVPSFSSNLICKGISKEYGWVVLKFGVEKKDFLSEVHALKYFAGRYVSQLFDVDMSNLILLEEYVLPGDELASENQMEKRVEVFCDLFKQLHNSHNTSEILSKYFECQSYTDWIFQITDYINQQKDWREVADHMNRAKNMYQSLLSRYDAAVLLHGDFHYHNILKAENGYKIIDPKGVIGDPVFDIPRYMLNEFWDAPDRSRVDETMNKVFELLNRDLGIPPKDLRQLLYIEGALSVCWSVEDMASLDQKPRLLTSLDYLFTYL